MRRTVLAVLVALAQASTPGQQHLRGHCQRRTTELLQNYQSSPVVVLQQGLAHWMPDIFLEQLATRFTISSQLIRQLNDYEQSIVALHEHLQGTPCTMLEALGIRRDNAVYVICALLESGRAITEQYSEHLKLFLKAAIALRALRAMQNLWPLLSADVLPVALAVAIEDNNKHLASLIPFPDLNGSQFRNLLSVIPANTNDAVEILLTRITVRGNRSWYVASAIWHNHGSFAAQLERMITIDRAANEPILDTPEAAELIAHSKNLFYISQPERAKKSLSMALYMAKDDNLPEIVIVALQHFALTSDVLKSAVKKCSLHVLLACTSLARLRLSDCNALNQANKLEFYLIVNGAAWPKAVEKACQIHRYYIAMAVHLEHQKEIVKPEIPRLSLQDARLLYADWRDTIIDNPSSGKRACHVLLAVLRRARSVDEDAIKYLEERGIKQTLYAPDVHTAGVLYLA